MSKKLNPHSKLIRRTIAIGEGSIEDFSVNGEVKFEKLGWDNYCIIDPAYGGLICDNKLVCPIKFTDTWTASTMVTEVAINGCDWPEEVPQNERKKTKTKIIK